MEGNETDPWFCDWRQYKERHLAECLFNQNLWRRQPCLITVNWHTYACSLYGVPHGSDTISGNNMDGQVCLHFTNSKTHGGKKVDGYHKEAIELTVTFRVIGQAVASGHMKEHGMVASDYAIKLINLMYPCDMSKVIEERQWQLSKYCF